MSPYRDEQSPFIDAHCHLFNIDDIPLYESIAGVVRMGTIEKLLVAFISWPAIVSGEVSKQLRLQKNFIRFFERDISSNIEWLARQLDSAVCKENEINKVLKQYGYTNKRIVVTPLVMDFDTRHLETDLGDDVSCEKQISRLFAAIKDYKPNPQAGFEIYPFMGFALDKLDKDRVALDKLQEWWEEHGYTREERASAKENPLPPGKAIGIKLYPPLGFNPCPDKEDTLKRYLDFFKWCIDKDIPITVHCQYSSYKGTQDGNKETKERTDPKNWERLFSEHPEIKLLRVNFGHFGGSAELKIMMKKVEDVNENYDLADSWSLTICKLLCDYKNTYADISAFGLDDDEIQKSLALLLGASYLLDTMDGLEGRKMEKLHDKIIWGSDLPMILSSSSFLDDRGKPSYEALLKKLQLGLALNKPFSVSDPNLPYAGIPFNMLTRTNPARFLFGLTDSV